MVATYNFGSVYWWTGESVWKNQNKTKEEKVKF